MAKVLMGLAAAVVIAVGGFFGFEFYTQHRIAGEVEAAFAQIRAGGGKATHGKVSFDLKSRTLAIAGFENGPGVAHTALHRHGDSQHQAQRDAKIRKIANAGLMATVWETMPL